MSSYLIYLFIASTTIASPGPGVVMTLTNSLKYGLKNSIAGIVGVSLGTFLIAILVGWGVGATIANSIFLYTTIKLIGSGYLLYLGFRLIKNRNNEVVIKNGTILLNQKKSFFYGLGITITNPKPIIFFIALFPQFISTEESYLPQFLLLSITFSVLIVIIHFLYGMFANALKNKTTSRNYFKYINIIGGIAYIGFSISLLIFSSNT